MNFKRVVWHKSFYELLATIRNLTRIGRKIRCADGVERLVFLAILILSADYEEQYDFLTLNIKLSADLCISGVLWH